MKCKLRLISLLTLCILLMPLSQAQASIPNPSYNQLLGYINEETYVLAPAAYTAEREYTFSQQGGLKNPYDIYADEAHGFIYVMDTGNSRILRCDLQLNVLEIISTFTFEGREESFRGPRGMYVHPDTENIYVCDTENGRIVLFDQDFNCLRIYGEPNLLQSSEALSYKYLPSKCLVDPSGQLFVIVSGLNQGMLKMDEEGVFVGYMGAPEVAVDMWQKFLRLFMTAEQKSKMEKFVPTEFDNFVFDEAGFIYAVSATLSSQMFSRYSGGVVVDDTLSPLKKLNPQGDNVLSYTNYPPLGDIYFDVPTKLVDVVYLGRDMYCTLDSETGRAFAYDGDGQFLYMFGGGAADRMSKGTQLGTFKTPMAIERVGERYYVLDLGMNSVTAFTPTEYGAAIETSVQAYYDGDYDAAYEMWERVLELNGNYYQAIEGMARVLLRKGEYKESLELFKTIDSNGKYASDAFEHYRKQLISDSADTITSVFIVLVILLVLWKILHLFLKLKKAVESSEKTW